jgi:tetratricopeptide (TPR) repeat protein
MRAPLVLAIGLLMSANAGCGKLAARDLIRAGNSLYTDGRLEEALAKYDEAAQLEPDGLTLYWNRACAAEALVLRLKDSQGTPEELANRKRYADQALADFQTWWDRYQEPKTEELKKQYGEHRLAILSADQRCDDLIAYWTEKLRATPKEEALYSTIARTYDNDCQKPEKANEWFIKRTQDFPDSPNAWYALAVRTFEPLMPDPSTGLSFNDSVDREERIRIANEVIGYLNKATELKPKYREPYIWRTMSYMQRQFARRFSTPPATSEEKLEAILAREDSMLAWKEIRARCDIDSTPDCPIEKPPAELLKSVKAFAGKDVLIVGKVVPESVKTVDAAKRTYAFDIQVTTVSEEEVAAKKPRGKKRGAAAKPVKETRVVHVSYTFAEPAKDEEGKPIDDSETIQATLDAWKEGQKLSLDGKLSDGPNLTVLQRLDPSCCPPPPITPAEMDADAATRKSLEAELAKAEARLKGKQTG